MRMKTKANLAAIGKVLIGVLYIIPILMGLLFSFQTNKDILLPPLKFFTANPTIENYIYALQNIPIFMYLKNTFIVILICVPCQLITSSLCAFGFSFYDFKGKNLLFTIFLSAMMIPGEVTLISNFATVQNMGLYNTYGGLTILSLTNVGCMFMLRQHMNSIPHELWEAARMDGCKEMTYFAKVVLPLSVPILSAQGITAFISTYNSYFWPMMITNKDEMRTIQVGVAQLMQSASATYGYVLAAAILCMIIPIVAYVFGQEYIVKGMTAGAVKS